MYRKSVKTAILLFLGVMLAVVPAVGCGGGGGDGDTEIVVGFLWDLTGRAALGVVQMYEGIRDYLILAEEQDPIEGVKIKVITYDTKSDASRVPIGYVWLKGKGASIMSASPQDVEVIADDCKTDQIPCFESSNMLATIDTEWVYSLYGCPESQIEVEMDWIKDNWDYSQGAPTIGFAGLAGVSFYVGQQQKVEEIVADDPDSFEYVGAQMAPTTTTTWAVEAMKLKNCDFIFAAMSGAPLAGFVRDARARGFEGTFVGPSESFWAFWELVKGASNTEDLDGVISGMYYPLWDEDVPMIEEIKSYFDRFVSDDEVDSVMMGTGRITGWGYALVLHDMVKRAVAAVGAENVDGLAMLEALEETDIDAVSMGWGNDWKLVEGVHAFARSVRLFVYDAAADKWEAVIDEWFVPPSLVGSGG